MGLFDDFIDTPAWDKKDTKIKYTPMKLPKIKHNTGNNIQKIKESEERQSALKKCGEWIYINSVEWCIALRGTHIHKKCMEEIFNSLENRNGTLYSEFVETLNPSWVDYWYNGKNHRHYTKQQLRRVEKEFDKGRDSEDLVMEMLQYVWFNMIPKDMLYEEIDDIGTYKLRVRWMK